MQKHIDGCPHSRSSSVHFKEEPCTCHIILLNQIVNTIDNMVNTIDKIKIILNDMEKNLKS